MLLADASYQYAVDSSKKSKILITGGAGFLGSHLAERLLIDGHEVVCLDNLYTGKRQNINHLRDFDNFTFLCKDVIYPFDVEVDQIYNLACPASPEHYQWDPIFTAKTCFLGTMNCLNLARKYGATMFQASTSEVYGDPEVHPQKENYHGNVNPTGIRSCYDEGKRIAETLCFDYKRSFGVDIRVARIFNTYGPRMRRDDGRVVSNFITQALSDRSITVYGDGSQTRSFCYYSDMIDAFIKFMNQEHFFGPINLGNPIEFTIYELARQVIYLSESNSKIIHKDLPSDDPTRRKPDIYYAKSFLNWSPKIQLHEGLIDTIKYFEPLQN